LFGLYENALVYRHADDAWFEVGEFVNRLADNQMGVAMGRDWSFGRRCLADEYCGMVRRAQEYIAAATSIR
jgi:hypothetical protein